MNEMELEKFEGIVSALLTPSTAYREKMAELIEFHLKHGVNGFFVLGTTGEGVKLGPSARQEVAEAAVEYAGSRGLVIIHVGASDMDTVKQLTRHASRIGAHAVSAVAPFYYRYDPDSLTSFYQSIADISSVPVLVYNNPGRQGYSIPIEGLQKILETVKPTVGLKESSGDPDTLLQVLKRFKGSRFLGAGGDHLMVYSFIIGYRVHVSSLSSIYPEIAKHIFDYVKNGELDEALRLQTMLNNIRAALKKVGPDMASNRYALKLRGIDIGGPIPPTRDLTPEEKRTLEKLLPSEQELRA
ncbi:MAG: dihydrodipicolinate synthase family protein [Candidatus Caldarchaeum sp.]|uniref:Dihydrodipicolinate synthase family protein n=1 Tax=Caldiarchaeum subterraneum TaxID=311458 RepID=A0A7C4I1F3_CALS0|nr:dihydrodipicolinate synthase family protein [Candidatus Caldarchaeales archaeon]